MAERLGIAEDLINESCSLAMKASSGVSSLHFIETKRPYSSVSIFAFPGSWSVEDWRGSPSMIDPALFPSIRSLGLDKPALVNSAFLRRFHALLSGSNFEQQVHRAISERKQIVYTGHSAGGAIATLATVWLLEQFRKLDDRNQSHTFCLTFGSPLVGDDVFGHAVSRENWSRFFIHFVMRYDVVPRISFVPLKSMEQEFQTMLLLLNPKSSYSVLESPGRSQQAISFFGTVMRYTCSVASQRACIDMGSTNVLLEEVSRFIELSPYSPSGTYIFSAGRGRLISLQNSNAIVHILYHCLQMDLEQESAEIAYRSLKEHLAYESYVQECLEKREIVFLDQLYELPLSSDAGRCNGIQSIDMVLSDLGLCLDARLFLRAAGESKMQVWRNKERIQANYHKIQEALNSLRRYKEICAIRNVGYYDSFKLQRDTEDFNANLKRYELLGIWDEIVEMLKRYELPDDFECQMDWVKLGTSYRRLVEPLDIANYYRHNLNEDSGPYLYKGRPKRYKYTQRWLEHACKITAWSNMASCFWAHVEELCVSNASARSFEEIKGRVLELEQDMFKWVNSEELDKDVFLESSTFVRWWKTLPQQHRSMSCIAKFMVVE